MIYKVEHRSLTSNYEVDFRTTQQFDIFTNYKMKFEISMENIMQLLIPLSIIVLIVFYSFPLNKF